MQRDPTWPRSPGAPRAERFVGRKSSGIHLVRGWMHVGVWCDAHVGVWCGVCGAGWVAGLVI